MFLCLAVPAQTSAPPTKTLLNAATATGDGDPLPVSYYNGAVVQVRITGTATITWKGTVDGTNYEDVQAVNNGVAGSSPSTTATASGIYILSLPGYEKFKPVITAYTSGTVTVVARQAPAYISKASSFGNIAGAASSTDNAIARFDGTGGKALQNSAVTVDDSGSVNIPAGQTYNVNGTPLATGVSSVFGRTGAVVAASGDYSVGQVTSAASIAAANAWADGIKQTFNPNGTNAGVNVGAQTGDPSTLTNGDLWYDSTGNLLRARINGASVSLGAGITNGAGANVIPKSDGTNLVASQITDNGTTVSAAATIFRIGDVNQSNAYAFVDQDSGQAAIGASASTSLYFEAGVEADLSAPVFHITAPGGVQFPTDNVSDIGASGATRPRTGYFGTSINIAGGTSITGHLSATAALNFANLATIGCEDLTITVTGASDGDTVALAVPNGSVVANGSFTAWVSTSNTVTVRFCTVVSGDPASGTFRVDVWKH